MAKKIFGKRTLAMVLVLVMCFSMLQMTVQAAPAGNNWSYAYYLGQEYLGNAAGAAVKPDPVGYGFQGVITQLTFTDDNGTDWTFKWSAEANGEWRITGSRVSKEKASAFPKVTADKIYIGYCGNKAYTFTLSQDGSAESWTYVNSSSRHANWFYYIRFIREYTVNVFYQNETGTVTYKGVKYAAQAPLVRYFQFLYPNGNIIDDSEYEDGEYTDPVTLLPKDYLGQELISQGYEIKYATDADGKDVLASGVTISLLGENVLNVYCTLIPKKTEDYKVIHEYYTDGQLDGTEEGKTVEVPENADFAEIVNKLDKDTEFGGNEYEYDRYEVDPENKTIVLVYERETPPTQPIEPSSEPTEPSSEPTEPSSEPTESSSEPTEPTEPTPPAKYTVTYVYTDYVPAGAPALPPVASYEAGEQVEIAQAPTMKNYTFSGWDKNDFTMPEQNVIVRGSWIENPKYDYALIYNANFGVNPAVNADSENISGIYATSHSIGVDSNRFVRPDYTFIGWNTQADGSGVSYKAGNVITLTAQENTKVLYAQWQENPKYSYTVQYNENYGVHPIVYRDSESVSNIYATGYTIGVDENRFNRVNYTFIGWNTAADGSGKAYREGETIALTAENNSAILYAQWQKNPKYDYEVIYNANFGAGQIMLDSQNVTGTYANPYTIGVDANRFTRPNYTFIGWAEEPQGQVVYQSGDSILFTESGSKTLYAKWIEHNKYSFTLIYNGNGGALADGHIAYGDSENAESIYENHLEITVDENTFIREGYTFIGWNTQADGSGITCDAEDLVALTAMHNTKTLYAQWQEIPKYDYEVIYNANYGNEPATRADDQNVEGVYSTALNISVDAEEFTREGYTFTGWNTEADGTGKAYKAGDIIALTAQENTEILYAQWSINEYEYTVQYVVRLDANPYAAFQGQLPENAPLGGKAVYGEVIDAATLQLPETITDGTYVYTYTAVDGIVIPFGTNTVIVYYSAVTPVVEIPEEEIPLVQPPANESAPVNPGSEPVPTTPTTPSAPLVELPDEEVPLADAPKTGDAMTLYMGLTALSGMGLLGLGLTKKKEENEEA